MLLTQLNVQVSSLFLDEVSLNMCSVWFVGFLFVFVTQTLEKRSIKLMNNFLLNFWTQSVFTHDLPVVTMETTLRPICLRDARTPSDLCPAGPAVTQ